MIVHVDADADDPMMPQDLPRSRGNSPWINQLVKCTLNAAAIPDCRCCCCSAEATPHEAKNMGEILIIVVILV